MIFGEVVFVRVVWCGGRCGVVGGGVCFCECCVVSFFDGGVVLCFYWDYVCYEYIVWYLVCLLIL